MPRKPRHTAKRIWERLKGEGFSGGYTLVKDTVRELTAHRQEVFVPVPEARDFTELNARLRQQCVEDRERRLRGQAGTKAELLQADQAAFLTLPLYVLSAGPVAWATNDAFHPAYLPQPAWRPVPS